MKAEFRPPRDNRLVIWAALRAVPLVARLWRRVVGIDVPKEDLGRLRKLRGQRFLLCSNHPTLGDPLVILDLARRAGLRLNGMAASDLFHGPVGWLIQRMGAYSVQRGAPDREAIRMTRRLLARDDRKVVIFPEGMTYERNDLLLPFQTGVIQIGFWALEDLEKLGKAPCLPLVPLAIKYLLTDDPRAAIDRRLVGLEQALGLPVPSAGGCYARLRAIGGQVLARIEQEYGLSPTPEASVAARIDAVKEHLLSHAARELCAHPPPGAPLAERMHFLDIAVEAYTAKYSRSTLEYEQRLHKHRLLVAAPLRADLFRFYNFIAVSDGYVAAGMTVERLLEVVMHLEVEVLGRPSPRLPTRAEVRVGEPLELGDFLDQYRQNKRAAVAAATSALQSRIQALLEPLSEKATPLAG